MIFSEFAQNRGETKIVDLGELSLLAARLRSNGKRIVHAHGVYDLLHLGHIRHLREARLLGDVLIVTLTEDRFVNKGPHRPAFTDILRAEALAALEVVDYVAVNHFPTAVQAINAIKPHVYAKGPDYVNNADDVTGAISLEEQAAISNGGCFRVTEGITFSSTALLNRYLASFPPDVQGYLDDLRSCYSASQLVGYLDRLLDMRVVVVGEAILDEYIYCDQVGKSAKEPVLAVRYCSSEMFAGGSLAVANHLAGFCKSVEIVTYLGGTDDQETFIRRNLKPGVRLSPIYKAASPTIVKRRYVEATLNVKMFEVYVINDDSLNAVENEDFCSLLETRLPGADAVVVADFGHGLLGSRTKDVIAQSSKFLAVNTQVNAANIRFHSISSYKSSDYVCINESELRIDARNRHSSIDELVAALATKLKCNRFLVTRGKSGVNYFDGEIKVSSPSLASTVVDRIGSGDAVLALTSVCVAAEVPAEAVAFLANVIGAQKVQILGNRSPVDRVSTIKFIQSILK